MNLSQKSERYVLIQLLPNQRVCQLGSKCLLKPSKVLFCVLQSFFQNTQFWNIDMCRVKLNVFEFCFLQIHIHCYGTIIDLTKDYIVSRTTTCFPLRDIYWWLKQNNMFDVWLDVHMVVSLILKTTDFTKNRKKSPRRNTLISWEEKSILNVFCQAAAIRPNSKHSFFFSTSWLVC